MEAEGSMFKKALAKKLCKKRTEKLNGTISWLRMKISCVRAALLCIISLSEAQGYKEQQ